MNMAKFRTPLLFFLALLLLSSVQATRHQKLHKTHTSIFSLPLHPLDSVRNPKNELNFTARTISRLAADVARLNSINSKLRHALNLEVADDIKSAPIRYVGPSGYVVPVGVGQPAEQFYLLADTGSDVTWFQCSDCVDCYGKNDPKFDPSKSSTYKPLIYSSKTCSDLHGDYNHRNANGGCNYEVSYGDKSVSKGEFATETLSFGSSSSSSINKVAIGCEHDNGGEKRKDYAGILGLGWGESIGFPSQIKATSFSYCLVDPDSRSSSTLEFNSGPPQDSVVVSMRRNPNPSFDHYYVELAGITVGEDEIPIPNFVNHVNADESGGIIVDSGTWFTYLDPVVYGSLIGNFSKKAQNLKISDINFYDTKPCYKASSLDLKSIPTMSLKFSDGQTLPLRLENYFVRVDDRRPASTYCLGFLPTSKIPSVNIHDVSIIGYALQQGMRVTYDLNKQRIGFSPNKC